MQVTYTKKCILLFIIGFLLIILDVNIDTGHAYPQNYANSDNAIGEFQYYNIKSAYGASCTYKLLSDDNSNESSDHSGILVIDKVSYSNIRFDIFNDFLGFALISIAAFLLRKGNRAFTFSFVCGTFAFILHGLFCLLPFVSNGIVLCNFVMAFDLAYIACGIFTTFFFTQGILALANDICCRDERIWIKIVWFITAVLQILFSFCYWLGADYSGLVKIGHFFVAITLILIIAYLFLVQRIWDYIQNNFELAKNKHK